MPTVCRASDALREKAEARIQALEQLRHSDRLATLGRLSSGIAHELGTPLNVVSGRARMIVSQTLEKKKVTESAKIIDVQAMRMTALICLRPVAVGWKSPPGPNRRRGSYPQNSEQQQINPPDPGWLFRRPAAAYYILHVLKATRNNRTRAAGILGLDRKTLYRKLQEYLPAEE